MADNSESDDLDLDLIAEDVRWLVGALAATNSDDPDQVHPAAERMAADIRPGAASPEFVTASTQMAYFLVGAVCHYSGRPVGSVLAELGDWAATLPEPE